MSQRSTEQHCHIDTPLCTIRKSHVTWNFAVPVLHSEEIRRCILLFLCTLVKSYDWLCMSVEKIKMREGSGGSACVRQWSTLKESSRQGPRSAMSWKIPGEIRARTCGTKSPSRSEALRFIDSTKSPFTVRSVFPSNVHINILRGLPCRLESLRLKFTNEPSIFVDGDLTLVHLHVKQKIFLLTKKSFQEKIPYLLELECSRVRSHKATGNRRNFKTGLLVTDQFRKSQFLTFKNLVCPRSNYVWKSLQ